MVIYQFPGNKCNYFINDQNSLINVVVPIFNNIKLNSSKYFQFLIFEKTVNLLKYKKHLTPEGKLEIIKYFFEMKNINTISRARNSNEIIISNFWLGGFTDGDGCFSCTSSGPRLKFENHEKELELFISIKNFLKNGNLNISSPRKNKSNSNFMVILDIYNIHILKNIVMPVYNKNDSKFKILNSQKYRDFCNWSFLVDIYYYGYHKLSEGINLINEIKSKMNNFRYANEVNKNIDSKISNLFLFPSPYEIKNGVRFLRGTNNLVSDKLKIIAIDENNNKFFYLSISECSKALNIGRTNIKNSILSGRIYKGYKFTYDI